MADLVPADLDAVYDRAPLRLLDRAWDFCCLQNVRPAWHADVSKLDRGRRWVVRATFEAGWHMEFEPARVDADALPHERLARLEFIREHGVKEVRVVAADGTVAKAFKSRLAPVEYARAMELLAGPGGGCMTSVRIHSWALDHHELHFRMVTPPVCVESLSAGLYISFK